ADLPNLPPCADPDDKEIAELLAKAAVRPVSYPDWQAIDAAEVARGKNSGKPREKFTRVDEMLDVLKKPRDTNGE
ncbi:MAG: NADP oxidoreductase, partial [Candidatus Hydrogenedentes bacterium]|nr:NADP oxidoreductase [Candidatus Hydrogenedentota bacterium]